jgi:methionine sulfoxide reductase heme-binding subunit
MHIQRQNGFGLAKPALKFWLLGVILASIALSISVFSAPLEISTWQHWARYTARLSFIFFLITYMAAPLYQLYDTSITRFLRRHRRNSGLSFALAHTIHLAALVIYLRLSPEPLDMATVIVGGGAYVAMFAMWASSSDAAIRWLGQNRWRQLHKFGLHYLAFVFVFTYSSGQFGAEPAPIILPILIWLAIMLRLMMFLTQFRKGKPA